MRKFIVKSIVSTIGIVFLCLNLSIAFGQNIAITDDDSYTANNSAILDVKSISKGLLIPRLTQAQRDVISSPAIGLIIYQTDNTPGIYYFDGTWKMLGVSSGDNLGNHVASQNIQLNNNWLSNDGDNEGIFVDNNGYVGIGITSPEEKLTIVQSTILGLTANDQQELMSIHGYTSNSRVLRYSLRRTITEASPTWHNTALRVEANVDDHASGQSWMEYRLGTNTLQNSIAFGEGSDAANEWMVIQDGNVGIGTSTPTSKLDVFGNANASTYSWTNGGVTPYSLTIGRTGSTSMTHPYYVYIRRSRDGSGLIYNNDVVGRIFFQGHTGTDYQTLVNIQADVDGVTSATSMPGRLIFGTTPVGSISPYERMRITNAGKVGIGTSTPTSKLDVFGNANASTYSWTNGGVTPYSLTIGRTGSTSMTHPYYVYIRRSRDGSGLIYNNDVVGRIFFQGHTGTDYQTLVNIQADVDGVTSATSMPGRLIFGTTPVGSISPYERMRITNAGKVGIGTNSPSALLHIVQSVTGTNNSLIVEDDDRKILIGRDEIKVQKTDGTPATLYVNNDGNNTILNGASGNVGIGTTNPGTRLQLYADGTEDINLDAISINRAGTNVEGNLLWMTNNTIKWFLQQDNDGTEDLTFYANGGANYVMKLNHTTGNVGIGTTNPNYKLTVAGGANGISVSGGNDGDRLLELKTDRPWYFEQEGNDASTILRLREYAAAGKSFYVDASGNFGVRSQDGSNYKFIVNSLGNIGIGTTTPTSRLDIKGGASVSDTILFSVKDKDGNNVFVVYPDAVQVIVPTDPLKDSKTSKRGAFVVSGRGATKGETNFMDMTKENYLIGHNVATGITTGTKNSVLGYEAGQNLSSGYKNVLLGYQAGQSLTSGSQNVMIGEGAGTSGNLNFGVFVGYHAGYNTTASYNTFVGWLAAAGNTSGDHNVSIGSWAGANNTTGSENVYIGSLAAWSNNGSRNVIIGCDVAESMTGLNDVLMIDNHNSGANPLIYGNFSTHIFKINGSIQYTGTITDISDKRLKRDLVKLDNTLNKLNKITGFYYNWKTKEYPDMILSDNRQIGVIAQEVELEYPELVITDEKGYKSVDYVKFTPILIEAIKEQQKQLDNKEFEIELLKEENQKLNERLEAVEEYINNQTK